MLKTILNLLTSANNNADIEDLTNMVLEYEEQIADYQVQIEELEERIKELVEENAEANIKNLELQKELQMYSDDYTDEDFEDDYAEIQDNINDEIEDESAKETLKQALEDVAKKDYTNSHWEKRLNLVSKNIDTFENMIYAIEKQTCHFIEDLNDKEHTQEIKDISIGMQKESQNLRTICNKAYLKY